MTNGAMGGGGSGHFLLRLQTLKGNWVISDIAGRPQKVGSGSETTETFASITTHTPSRSKPTGKPATFRAMNGSGFEARSGVRRSPYRAISLKEVQGARRRTMCASCKRLRVLPRAAVTAPAAGELGVVPGSEGGALKAQCEVVLKQLHKLMDRVGRLSASHP